MKVIVFSALLDTPVPPLAGLKLPATVIAPVVAVLGVKPVVPNDIDATVLVVVATVPDVGSVRFVAPVVVNVRLLDPDVATVEPSAKVKVAPVAGAVKLTLLILVAVATPKTGVVSVGEEALTTLPVPVFATHSGAVAPELTPSM